MIVDAHHHLWRRGESDHDWSRFEVLDRAFLADDLVPRLEAAEVEATVLVQTANSLADTDRLLDRAETIDVVAGVVGWLPLEDPAATAAALAARSDRSALRGVRHLTNLGAADAFLERAEVRAGLEVLASHDLVLDVVPQTPAELDQVVAVADALPDLRVVVDHLGRPPVPEDGWEPWAGRIAEVAQRPNVAVKASVGLDVLLAWGSWDGDALRPYVEHVVDAFGPSRVLAASNWPVVLLGAGYEDAWATIRRAVAHLADAEVAEILGGSARRWYRLPGMMA